MLCTDNANTLSCTTLKAAFTSIISVAISKNIENPNCIVLILCFFDFKQKPVYPHRLTGTINFFYITKIKKNNGFSTRCALTPIKWIVSRTVRASLFSSDYSLRTKSNFTCNKRNCFASYKAMTTSIIHTHLPSKPFTPLCPFGRTVLKRRVSFYLEIEWR